MIGAPSALNFSLIPLGALGAGVSYTPTVPGLYFPSIKGAAAADCQIQIQINDGGWVPYSGLTITGLPNTENIFFPFIADGTTIRVMIVKNTSSLNCYLLRMF